MQDLNPDKMSTEDLQKMLAELKGVANAQMAKPEEDAAKKQALAASGQTIQSLQAEAADAEEEELTGAEKKAHETKVREEGLSAVPYLHNKKIEITLEIDEEGSSKEFNAEGAKTIENDKEFQKLKTQLKDARSKDKNKLGEGGFFIDLNDPQ